MSLVPSLLQAIVHVGGEALVLHVGEKPYVVTPTGQVDLATRGLTLDAVSGIVAQLLPIESQRALDEFGAAQYALPPRPEFPGEQFTIVVALGGDDVWAEIRRRRMPDDDVVPMELFGPTASQPAAKERPPAVPTMPVPEQVHARRAAVDDGLQVPDVGQLWSDQPPPSPQTAAPGVMAPRVVPKPSPPVPAASAPLPPYTPAALISPPAPPPQVAAPRVAPLQVAKPPIAPPLVAPPPVSWTPAPAPPPQVAAPWITPPQVAKPPIAPPPVAPPPVSWTPAPARQEPPKAPAFPAVVLPMARSPIRPDVPLPIAEQPLSSLDQLLRLAAARGASILYLSSVARPSVRVDGDVILLEGAPVLEPNDVESLLLTLMPERNAEALRTGVASEWICDVADVGRVRCLSFRDHRGPGGVFRMLPVRAVSAEQLGLSREIQALAIEPEGLILVAGPRSSGKRTLMSALVDLINRTRRDHVITIESDINVVHDRRAAFISQREVRGSSDDVLAVARAALREDPDILVLEELRTAALMNVALDAAASGQLVIGGFPAHDASGAIDRIIDLYPPQYRRQVQLSLAQNLRGVVAQVLLRRIGGGRVAAREVMLNTPAVAGVLAEGKTSQLPLAIEGGRRQGMVPLTDALVGFVQSGAVDLREAFRRAPDRAAFLALLKRQGVDTSPVERLA